MVGPPTIQCAYLYPRRIKRYEGVVDDGMDPVDHGAQVSYRNMLHDASIIGLAPSECPPEKPDAKVQEPESRVHINNEAPPSRRVLAVKRLKGRSWNVPQSTSSRTT